MPFDADIFFLKTRSRRGARWSAKARARLLSVAALAALLGPGTVQAATPEPGDAALRALGERLFFDPGLSYNGKQSCASCHQPDRAFSDGRGTPPDGAASLGADGRSLGDRNTPSISYAATVPEFGRAADGEYIGGLFHDGRARDLTAQAGDPITNPIEMALPDQDAAVAYIRRDAAYVAAFDTLFGATVFNDSATAFSALTTALAAFQQGAPFVAFDSRYDRYLRGEYQLTMEEELGRRLFFSDLLNCMNCHLRHNDHFNPREPFTDHRYYNIGIPENTALRAVNGTPAGTRDSGLAQNPAAEGSNTAGRFRTPTLRNIMITAPYMHNGVFSELETAIHFYNQYVVVNGESGINPETGRAWRPPEVDSNIALDKLREGQPLNAARIRSLMTFLRTLTDQRYEHLLSDQGEHSKEAP